MLPVLHLASFWGFFGMEVGMLMPPAPLGPPPGWAGGERGFFLFSFGPPPGPPSPHPHLLPFVVDPGQDAGWVGARVRPAGWRRELAGRAVPPSDRRPQSTGTREQGMDGPGPGPADFCRDGSVRLLL